MLLHNKDLNAFSTIGSSSIYIKEDSVWGFILNIKSTTITKACYVKLHPAAKRILKQALKDLQHRSTENQVINVYSKVTVVLSACSEVDNAVK